MSKAMWIVYYLPKKLLSKTIGILAYIPLPAPLSTMLISWFVSLSGARLDEAEKHISEYRSIGDFFIRSLRSDVRPIQGDFVSPIDGTLRSIEKISNGSLHQVKGMYYSVAELLADKEYADRFDGGSCYNFYLSPKDYHHVHVPIAGRLEHARLCQGTLWPVNEWSYHSIEGLFTKNERIVIRLSTEFGACAIVMVGALNVGAMRVSFDDSLRSYTSYPAEGRFFDVAFAAGDHLGYFRLGSSVLLLFERPYEDTGEGGLPRSVVMGEPLSFSDD